MGRCCWNISPQQQWVWLRLRWCCQVYHLSVQDSIISHYSQQCVTKTLCDGRLLPRSAQYQTGRTQWGGPPGDLAPYINVNFFMVHKLLVRSFGRIWIWFCDARSHRSRCIKGTELPRQQARNCKARQRSRALNLKTKTRWPPRIEQLLFRQ